MVAKVASMAHIAIHLVHQIANQARVTMSLAIVLRVVTVDSMVFSVKTFVLQTATQLIVTEIRAIVTLAVLPVSLVIVAMKNALLTV